MLGVGGPASLWAHMEGVKSGATLGLALRVSSPQASLAGATGNPWEREGDGAFRSPDPS